MFNYDVFHKDRHSKAPQGNKHCFLCLHAFSRYRFNGINNALH